VYPEVHGGNEATMSPTKKRKKKRKKRKLGGEEVEASGQQRTLVERGQTLREQG
jgi:hypothetical protein